MELSERNVWNLFIQQPFTKVTKESSILVDSVTMRGYSFILFLKPKTSFKNSDDLRNT